MSALAASELPIEGKTVKAMATLLAKRTHDLFRSGVLNNAEEEAVAMASQERRVACKVRDEYAHLANGPYGDSRAPEGAAAPAPGSGPGHGHGPPTPTSDALALVGKPTNEAEAARKAREALSRSRAVVERADGSRQQYVASIAVAKRLASRWPRPQWHPPWRLYRTIAGHLGPVRSVAFDPGNDWFATGSGDRTIKVWDTASGALKLTLTGHIEQVTGLAVSRQHPYMFSCGLDKKVMCWDLEQNKTIRHYHGHLSGVMAVVVHPVLPLLMTGGRDSTCRLWDMRTRVQVHCMSGHQGSVASVLGLPTDPQCITGSHDNTVRLWDIRMGKAMHVLTHHKKSIRALAMCPTEFAFLSGSPDNIKKFKLPDGEFCHNMIQKQETIINTMAINEDGVVVSGGDNGSLWFWDWTSGNCFQKGQTIAQPGSLESENGIYALSFDMSGSRIVTCEADKTIKMWKPDETATPDTHPVDFRPPKDVVRRY